MLCTVLVGPVGGVLVAIFEARSLMATAGEGRSSTASLPDPVIEGGCRAYYGMHGAGRWEVSDAARHVAGSGGSTARPLSKPLGIANGRERTVDGDVMDRHRRGMVGPGAYSDNLFDS